MLGDTRIWTMDLSDCSRLLYHWAISPYVENIVSSEERQVGVTCQNCQSPLAVETKSKCHHYRSTNCISEHLKRRWYNGQHSCLPSSWSGFDSRPTQCFKFDFGQKWDQKVFVHAVTRIRTWVVTATTWSTNHYTITARNPAVLAAIFKHQYDASNHMNKTDIGGTSATFLLNFLFLSFVHRAYCTYGLSHRLLLYMYNVQVVEKTNKQTPPTTEK